MLLAVDVGNTQTVLGLFAGEELREQWRLSTVASTTTDELDAQLVALLARRGLAPDAISGGVVSTTVPRLQGVWERTLERLAGRPTVVVGPGVRTGIPIRYENRRGGGPGRLGEAAAAVNRFGARCAALEVGTSTNFDVVAPEGEYIGGVIAPGVNISMEALTSRAARLGKVELAAPPAAIGRNTVHAMQSGAVYGFAGQVDGIVRRIWAELGGPCPTVATGGIAPLMHPFCETTTELDREVTLLGLRLIWDRNGDGG